MKSLQLAGFMADSIERMARANGVDCSELVGLLRKRASGELGHWELDHALLEIEARAWIHAPVPAKRYPREAAQRWVDSMSGDGARDHSDAKAIVRSREQYFRWYAQVRSELVDLLLMAKHFWEHPGSLFDQIANAMQRRMDAYEAQDVPYWPPHYAKEVGSEPHLGLIEAYRGYLGAIETKRLVSQ